MKNYGIETKRIIDSLIPSKHNPMYDASMYWSQKSFNIASSIIELFTEKNDIVFDPFLGSGVTLIESVSNKLNRRCIGCEINEEPVFLVKSSLQKNNAKTTIKRLNEFLHILEQISEKYYSRRCDKCGQIGIIKNIVFDIEDSDIKIKAINLQCRKDRTIQVAPSECDYINFDKEYNIDYIENELLITNTKIAVKKGMHIKDIFTNRNFKVLDEIIGLKKSAFKDIESIIDYVLIGIIHLCKITDTHSNSQWPLWTPKKDCVEKNVILTFQRRAKKVIFALQYTSEYFSRSYEATSYKNMLRPCGYLIHHKGIQNVTENDIPDNSVDFILTDPPYLGQVAYSEYMQLYKPFLGFDFNLEDEIVVSSSPQRNKTTEDYFALMNKAFEVCSKKLKDQKYLCLYFHDCNLDVWNKLMRILSKNGFKYLSQVHVNKTVTLKNIISPKKSLNGDSLLIFQKTNEIFISSEVCKENIEEIEHNVIKEARHMIYKGGPQSTPELYDNGIMDVIISNGWLEALSQKHKSLVEIFEKYLVWDKDSARWQTKSVL